MDDSRDDEDQAAHLRKLLSKEELRALLSPLPDSAPLGEEVHFEPEALLFITPRADDVESVGAHLEGRGVTVIPAIHRYGGLDLLRRRAYCGVVISMDALGLDVAGYLARIREVDASVPIRFVCDPGEQGGEMARSLIEYGRVVERPFMQEALERLFDFLETPGRGDDSDGDGFDAEDFDADAFEDGPGEEFEEAAAGDDAATREELGELPEQGDPGYVAASAQELDEPDAHAVDGWSELPDGPDPDDPAVAYPVPEFSPPGDDASRTPAPDALLGVRCILEEQRNGLEGGLRLWVSRDPAFVGMVSTDLRRGSGDSMIRGHVPDDPGDRISPLPMLKQRVAQLESLAPSGDTSLASLQGAFVVLTLPDGGGSHALWSGGTPFSATTSICEELNPLLPHLLRTPAGTGANVRETLLDVLASRMHGCARKDGRLALLVADGDPGMDAVTLRRTVRGVLRSSDWLSTHRSRVYALLDDTHPGWSLALRERLQSLPGSGALRVIGKGWAPGQESAQALLDGAEKKLTDRPGPVIQLDD